MVKKYRLLFVMSIISFVLSALCMIGGIIAFSFANNLEETTMSRLDNILSLLGLGLLVVMILTTVIAAVTAGVTVLLGILGMVCCKKQGKCSLGCLILGGIFSLFTAASIVHSIADGTFEAWVFLILVYFGLYTAGAAIAYIDSRNDKKERIEKNDPYPF